MASLKVIGLILVVVLLFVLKFATKAPYTVKWILYTIGCGLVGLVSIPFMLLRPRDYRNALIPAWSCTKLCKVIGVTMEVRGVENIIPRQGGVIIMNHQSALDLCALSYLWPKVGKATVVVKKEILYYPFFGLASWLWGAFFISRSNETTIKRLQAESRAINEQKCKLLIFPEGKRNSSSKILPFKKGAFHMALDSGCPIQPVVISRYWFLNGEAKYFVQGHAVIKILPEIPSVKYTKENILDFAEDCRSLMQEEFDRLSEETKPLFQIPSRALTR